MCCFSLTRWLCGTLKYTCRQAFSQKWQFFQKCSYPKKNAVTSKTTQLHIFSRSLDWRSMGYHVPPPKNAFTCTIMYFTCVLLQITSYQAINNYYVVVVDLTVDMSKQANFRAACWDLCPTTWYYGCPMMTMVAWTHTMLLIVTSNNFTHFVCHNIFQFELNIKNRIIMFVLIILNGNYQYKILFMYFCQINKSLQSFLNKMCLGLKCYRCVTRHLVWTFSVRREPSMLSDCAEIVAHFGYVGGWLWLSFS